jgi:16S rRNA G966 N2-methylase RsmD
LDYLNGLKAVNRDFTRIDFAFFDPPYYSGIYEELLNNLIQIDCLENSRIIIEHYKKIQISPPPSLEILRTSKIGDTHLTFIKFK